MVTSTTHTPERSRLQKQESTCSRCSLVNVITTRFARQSRSTVRTSWTPSLSRSRALTTPREETWSSNVSTPVTSCTSSPHFRISTSRVTLRTAIRRSAVSCCIANKFNNHAAWASDLNLDILENKSWYVVVVFINIYYAIQVQQFYRLKWVT